MPYRYCLLLNTSLLEQSDFAAKSTTIWLSLYRVEKNLTESEHLIKQVGNPYTWCVYRKLLQTFTTFYQVEDIHFNTDNFRPDPSIGKYKLEHEMVDEALEKLP